MRPPIGRGEPAALRPRAPLDFRFACAPRGLAIVVGGFIGALFPTGLPSAVARTVLASVLKADSTADTVARRICCGGAFGGGGSRRLLTAR
jgi:hypothetical protein